MSEKNKKDSERVAKLAAVLHGAIEAHGGVQRMAAQTGIPAANFYKWREGNTLPSVFALEAIATACGIDLATLIGADAPARPPGSQKAYGQPLEVIQQFDYVPRMDVRASAGVGHVNHDVSASADAPMIAFPHDFLRRIGLVAGRVHAIVAIGDSMEPTIRDGDLLLVDRTMATIVDDGIYIMTLGDAVVVKRVQRRRDGTVWLISDNRERYEPEVVPAADVGALVVEGRVRWFGRTI